MARRGKRGGRNLRVTRSDRSAYGPGALAASVAHRAEHRQAFAAGAIPRARWPLADALAAARDDESRTAQHWLGRVGGPIGPHGQLLAGKVRTRRRSSGRVARPKLATYAELLARKREDHLAKKYVWPAPVLIGSRR